MGAFLWVKRRGSYAWYIGHGHLAESEVPLEATCPYLRVAHHVPYWDHDRTHLRQRPPEWKRNVHDVTTSFFLASEARTQNTFFLDRS